MADKIAFTLYDSLGAPKTDALSNGLAFVIYRTKAGIVVAPPAITHLGGGVYGFQPPTIDQATGMAYMIDCGTGSFPTRLAGSVSLDSDPFGVFLLVDSVDTLWGGTAPTMPIYKDFSGTTRTAPTMSAVAGAYLYVAEPSAGDLLAGVGYRVDSPAGAYPSNFGGSFYSPETATVLLPTYGLYDGDFTIPFVSVAQAPTIIAAEAIDGNTLRVIFSESVLDADALIPTNYVITGGGGLTVSAVVKETDRFYVLTTSDQTPGVTYTVTVSNVRDLKQNPV